MPVQWRHRYATLGLAVVAWTLALASVLSIGNQQPTWLQGLLLVLASALLTLALPNAPRALLMVKVLRVARGRRLYGGVTVVVLGCAVAAVAAATGYQNFDNLFYTGLLQYLAGAVLISVGLALVTGWRPHVAPACALIALRRHRFEATAICGVLALGLVLRVYQLGYWPPPQGYFIIDEPQLGGEAYDFLHFARPDWIYPELVYSIALSFKLFGASMVTIRYPTVAAGFIALIVFYILARTYFEWPVAALGTALMAVSRLEINYSRLVLPSVTTMVLELIIFTLGIRAIRGRGTYLNYAIMGFLTGIGMYSHASFRLTPLLLALFLVGWLCAQRRQIGSILRTHAPGWALYLVVFILVVMPYLGITRNSPQAFTERFTSVMPLIFNQKAIADPGAIFRGNLQSLLAYFVTPSDGPWITPPGFPTLDPVTASLFLLGLGYALLHLWRPYILMIVTWLLLTLTTGALFTTDVRPERFVAYQPALFLLACLPIAVFWSRVRELPPRWVRGAALALVALLGVAGWSNVDTLFNHQSHDPIVRAAFHAQEVDLTLYFRDHGHDGMNYVMAGFPFPGLQSDYGWIGGDPEGRKAADLADLLPIHDPVDGTTVHIAINDPYPITETARAVGQIYPGAQTSIYTAPDTSVSYSAVAVSATVIAAQQRLSGPCPTAAPCGDTTSTTSSTSTASRFWSGSVYVPVTGSYTISATTPAVPAISRPRLAVRLDGAPLTGPIMLYTGWHSLNIEARGARPSSPPVPWWSGPAGAGPIPAAQLHDTLAYGMLLQYLTATGPDRLIVDPQRVPFPYFFLLGDQQGRPSAPPGNAYANQLYPYRAVLTGRIAPGHAGTYPVDLYSLSGAATLFLDGRRIGSGQSLLNGPPSYTSLRLRLNGRGQTLQLQYSTPSIEGMNAGMALFYHPSGGAEGFLPWSWLTPPRSGAPLPRWLPG